MRKFMRNEFSTCSLGARLRRPARLTLLQGLFRRLAGYKELQDDDHRYHKKEGKHHERTSALAGIVGLGDPVTLPLIRFIRGK